MEVLYEKPFKKIQHNTLKEISDKDEVSSEESINEVSFLGTTCSSELAICHRKMQKNRQVIKKKERKTPVRI